jgi:hypothetical protein
MADTEWTSERIAELRRLANEAGLPWTADLPRGPAWEPDRHKPVAQIGADSSFADVRTFEGQAYIVAACNAMPSLLDELERVTRERDEALATVAHFRDCFAQ